MAINPEQDELRFMTREARSPRVRTMREFALDELVIPDGPFAGRRFRVDRQPFAGCLLDALDDFRWRRRCITGPSQSGKTLVAFCTPTMYHLFERNETVVLGIPSLDMSGDKWREDLLPAIEASRFSRLIPKRGPGSRGGNPDAITFLNGATLRFMSGGGGDKVRAGFTTRVVIVTETDGMDTAGGTSREADKIRQLEARSRAWGDRAVTYLECTVSLTTGRTWREYSNGTATRLIKQCPYCKRWVQPEREHLRGWRNAADEIAAADGAHFICPQCEHALTDDDRRAMCEATRMLHRGQHVTKRGVIRGTPHRTRTLGFRWSAFDNLFASAAQLGADEWTAERSGDGDDAQKACKQFIWCIPVEDDTVETDELRQTIITGQAAKFTQRLSTYDPGEITEDTRGITVFIDVGANRLHFETNAHTKLSRDVIEYGEKFTNRINQTTEQAIKQALAELYRAWCADPYAMPIGLVLVDKGNWGETVCEACRDLDALVHSDKPAAFDHTRKNVWMPSAGQANYRHPPKPTPDKKPSKSGDPWYRSRLAGGFWVINFDPNFWKACSHDSWRIRPMDDSGNWQRGCVTLFGSDPYLHSEFASHITAEEFRRWWDPKKGWLEAFVKVRKQNHLFDCDVGNILAASVLFDETPARKKRKQTGEWFKNQQRRTR